MVAVEQKDRNADCCEPTHLPNKEKPRLVITPVPVIEIARNDDKGDLFLQSQTDEVLKRLTSCRPNTVSRTALLLSKAFQGAVEMNVCRVDKPE